MSNTKKRVYRSEARHAQAEQTKRRILSSANMLFASEGFENVTIDKIAQTAEVSVPTVYALFQSKRGILHTLMDEALPPDQHQTLVEQAYQAQSAEDRLLITAKIARQIYEAEKAQMDIFRGASVLAPEFKKLEKEWEERRYHRLEKTIELLAHEKALAPELTPSKARDILWAFTGRDLYRMFVIERGWTPDAYEIWLGQMLINSLLTKTADSENKQDKSTFL